MKSLSKFNNQLLSWDKAISIYTASIPHCLRVSIRHFVRVNPDVIDINRFFIFRETPYTIPPAMKKFYYDRLYNEKPLSKIHFAKKQKPIITIRGASK